MVGYAGAAGCKCRRVRSTSKAKRGNRVITLFLEHWRRTVILLYLLPSRRDLVYGADHDSLLAMMPPGGKDGEMGSTKKQRKTRGDGRPAWSNLCVFLNKESVLKSPGCAIPL